MPYSKSLSRYGQEYFDLAAIALPCHIVCQDERAARGRATRIRYFIKAIEDNEHPDKAKLLSLIVRTKDNVIIIEDRDNDSEPSAVAFRNAIAAAKLPASPTPPPLNADTPPEPEITPTTANSAATECAIDKWLKG